MIAYVNENGMITSTPPDTDKKRETNWKISKSVFPKMILLKNPTP